MSQTMKPLTAAAKLGIYLPAAPEEFQTTPITRDELDALEEGMEALFDLLKPAGRLAVITFHSLEDRMVKQAMRHWAEGCRCPRHVLRCVCGHEPEVRILFKKPLQAGADELATNSRAGSAKLRAIEKIAEGSGS